MKEKAEELVEKFIDYSCGESGDDYNRETAKRNAKQCALIAVEEIIEAFISIRSDEVGYQMAQKGKYWQNVKKEIENL